MPPLLEGCIFHNFTFHNFTFPPQPGSLSATYTSLHADNVRNANFTFFPPNPSTRPSEALWAQNEGIEKTAQTEPDGPFLHIFVRLTSHFTSFRSPICSPSRPPFSGPPENAPCKTHRHLCISTHPPIQFATPPLTFQSFPPASTLFLGGTTYAAKVSIRIYSALKKSPSSEGLMKGGWNGVAGRDALRPVT